MGLSVAIAGAIVLSVLMFVLMSMNGMTGNIFSVGDASTQISELENTIHKTDISLETLFAQSGLATVNFTLNNDDQEKLWNFDEFNVIVEYEAGSGKLLEELTFSGDCLGVSPSAGNWCIEGISGDFWDEGILNEGENAEIFTQVSNTLVNQNVRVTVSTDNGVVAKLPAPKRSWYDANPVPTAFCEFPTHGRTFVDTDTGVSYICDPTRDKWLSTETITLYGENDKDCENGWDIGTNRECVIRFGDGLGGGDNDTPDMGLYIPYNMTITAWAFSSGDFTCGSTFDLEVWGSGTDLDDQPLSLGNGAAFATGLDSTPQNDKNADVDIEGNQYIIWGIDNNCGGGSPGDVIEFWNIILYTKWRHDNP